MRRSRIVAAILCVLVLGTFGIMELRHAREKAQAGDAAQEEVRTSYSFEQPFAREQEHVGIIVDDEAQELLGDDATREQVFAMILANEYRAIERGMNYNPHVTLPDGRQIMVQDEQMVEMVMQHPGNKPGFCIDGDHLPEQMPEGSEKGCQCGAHCDEDGKRIEGSDTTCKRRCNRVGKCKCGACI